ncbi:MAG: hypothetical protein DCC49_06880 [Acidobacteria bacterium]|nr:MAG: hypothetical protein DCC49_06880 [Acidobacteriota bacterium]
MTLEGPPAPRPVAPQNLLEAGLRSRPDEVAITSLSRSLTWRELDEASNTLALNYRALGLERGDRIASLLPNRVELAIHYIACFKSGIVATPFNYRYAAAEIDHALEVGGAKMLVAHSERDGDIAASRLASGLELGHIRFGDASLGERDLETLIGEPIGGGPSDEVNRDSLDPAAPAAIFFTSGSTGPAKGVTHSLETLGWALAIAGAAFELTEDDVFLPASSMSHIGSFLWTLATLSVGARAVVAHTVDSHEVFALLKQERPTVLAMIPAALTALIRDHDATSEDFESLRLCRAGADKVSAELESEFSHLVGFPIDEGYGMTEVGLASLNPPSGVIKNGSIGCAVPGFGFELRDDSGAEVPIGEVGRAWLRSPSVTTGYWQDPGATDEVLRDGWLDSGDLMRADEDGYLWFFGRKKQIIVHDGSNISPLEVEGALLEHPAVAACGVVGIHDSVHGENVRAYISLRAEVDAPTSPELIAFARERVTYKAPEEIVFLDEMPLNPTGKVDRVGLKKLAEEHLNPHDA